jgi:hypothetical protein
MSDQNQGAQPNVPQPPPPQQPPRRHTVRWLLIGAGGCLLLLLLVVVGFGGCMAAIIGTSGGGGGEQSPQDKYAAAKEKAAPIGQTVTAGKVEWTVQSVEQVTQLKSLGQKKNGNFIVVHLIFKNNDNEPATLDSSSLAILDDKGRTSETDPDASMYVPTNQDLFLNQVNPGVSKQGEAIFDVAPDAKGLILRAGDTNPFGGENAYVDLGI